MKNALSYLSVILGLVAIVFIFIQGKEIDRLSAQLELATINAEFQTILSLMFLFS